MKKNPIRRWLGVLAVALTVSLVASLPAGAHDDADSADSVGSLERPNRGDELSAHDAATSSIVSSGPFAQVTKNIDVRSIGVRDDEGSTTDVWALNGYAYTGTFSAPCGGDPEAGIWVWDTSNPNKAEFVTVIQSPAGSRANDVRAASMNSGDILVHSNEACGAGGPGGFEVYNVDDPTNPVHLASVQTDDVNGLLRSIGFVDFGVHNLFLFTQGDKDYVGVVVESEFGNFQIFDLDDLAAGPVGSWGAESLLFPAVDFATTTDFNGVILPADAYLFTGYGASANRFLHDITITADGSQAYLASWDAGLILLDISDVTSPSVVSVAIDTVSEDGEVNSHSVWPSEDGSIVIEGEEDFAPFSTQFTIDTGADAGAYASSEGAITVPIVSLPGQTMTGATTYVGLACDPITAGSGIALIQRGICAFTDKVNNAEAAGYSGVVVFNDAARGDALVTMGGVDTNLPGVFVGHSTGLSIAGVATTGDLVVDASGETISVAVIADGWSGYRIWDYSDPSNPVLASIFNTVCSANPVDASCDPAGTYSAHNVMVETTGNKVKAYISWYTDGILILDISDPYNPVEIARYTEEGTDFWGIYKEPNSPFLYGSDRNGGLYVFKELGSGSGGK